MEELIPIVAIISVFGGGILFVKVLTDFFLKRKIIDKGIQGPDIQNILRAEAGANQLSGLKWGLILFAAGVGLIIINYVPYDADTPFPYGVLSVCIALGFLTYYYIVKSKEEV